MQVQEWLREEMAQVEALMRAEMRSEVPLVEWVLQYSLGQGGKRFRPMLCLLSSVLCGDASEPRRLAAALIEFIHSATLLHDDVVDESPLRRAQPAAQLVFGNAASVLVGDFLYTRAFQMLVRIGRLPVLATMADAVNLIAAGEVLQLHHVRNADLDESAYFRVIELKTAVLFAAACRIAAQIQGASPEQEEALHRYGQRLGMAFQVMDDVLDYEGEAAEMGKARGDDLREGKMTLVLIRTLACLPPAEALQLRRIIEEGEGEAFAQVWQWVQDGDALEYCRRVAEQFIAEAVAALQIFPANAYRGALEDIARQCLQRRK